MSAMEVADMRAFPGKWKSRDMYDHVTARTRVILSKLVTVAVHKESLQRIPSARFPPSEEIFCRSAISLSIAQRQSFRMMVSFSSLFGLFERNINSDEEAACQPEYPQSRINKKHVLTDGILRSHI